MSLDNWMGDLEPGAKVVVWSNGGWRPGPVAVIVVTRVMQRFVEADGRKWKRPSGRLDSKNGGRGYALDEIKPWTQNDENEAGARKFRTLLGAMRPEEWDAMPLLVVEEVWAAVERHRKATGAKP